MLAEEAASSFVTFFPDRNPRWVLGRAAARPLEATLEFGQVSEWPGGGPGWWRHAKSFCPSQYKAPQRMHFLGALGSRFPHQGSRGFSRNLGRLIAQSPC